MRAGSRHGESRRNLRIGWVNPRRDNGDNFAVISRLFVYGTLARDSPMTMSSRACRAPGSPEL
jgi:hypothetical protein